jgi:hypothetical protein
MSTLENQLKLLISLCEEEKIRLQKSIEEYLLETEYLMAHYHSKALDQLNSRLQTLHNIDDNLYDAKYFKKRTIDLLQKQLKTGVSDLMKEYYIENIQSEKEELERLNQIPKKITLSDSNTLLDLTLRNLVDKKNKNLKLILKKSDNLFLGFSYSKKILKVTLPYIKQHTKKWILHEDKINALKNLGFNLTENETKLTLILTGNKEDILIRLKIILSKIIFEIFYFKEFNKECFIQFTEKSSS